MKSETLSKTKSISGLQPCSSRSSSNETGAKRRSRVVATDAAKPASILARKNLKQAVIVRIEGDPALASRILSMLSDFRMLVIVAEIHPELTAGQLAIKYNFSIKMAERARTYANRALALRGELPDAGTVK